jgi:ABC-2 type transport system permease protein
MKILPPWILQVIGLELKKKLQYRLDVWGKLFFSLFSQLVIAYFLWRTIFTTKQVELIGGFSFHGMMLYYLIASFLIEIIVPPFHSVSDEIYKGTLNRYLVYPVSFPVFKFCGQIAALLFGAGQLILALSLFFLLFGSPPEMHFTWSGIVCGVFSVALSVLLYYIVTLNLEMIAFWSDSVWSLGILFQFLVSMLGGRALPLSIFPEWSQILLHALPFPYLISLPIRTLLGQVSFAEWSQGVGILFLWAVLFALSGRAIWTRGIRNYSGVGI